VTAAVAGEGDTLRVSGELEFGSAGRLLEEGERWLRGPAPSACRLDLAAVTRCNSAGVALVLGWLRAAGAGGKTLQLDNVPQALQSLLHLAGLESVLSPELPATGAGSSSSQ